MRWNGRARTLAGALLALGLVAGATACGGDASSGAGPSGDDAGQTDCSGESGEAIAIGGNFPLTGPASNIGAYWDQGIKAAADVVNERGISVDGKCYYFEAQVEDNQTDPEQAIGVSQRFQRDGVRFQSIPITTMFAPVWETLKGTDVLTFTSAGPAAELLGTDEAKYLFRGFNQEFGPDGSLQRMGRALVARYSPERVAILLPNDEPGQGQASELTEAFEGEGVDVVYSESFAPDTRDFAPFIADMRNEAPDLVVTGYLGATIEPFLDQAVDAGMSDPAFAGTPGAAFSDVDGKPEITRYGLTVLTKAIDDDSDTTVDTFRAAYEEVAGSAPDAGAFYALMDYDQWLMLAKAMEVAGSVDDLDAIAEALKSDEVLDYPGRALDISFDEKGQASYPTQMGYVEDGEVSYELVD